MNLIGKILNNRYKIVERIAEGGMSTIYRACDIDSETESIAVKILKSDATSRRVEDVIRFRSEADILTRLDHHTIIKIYGIGEIFELHYLLMEFIEGNSLLTILEHEPISIDQGVDFFRQICIALNYMHRNGILHRDLKPGNVMRCLDGIKLIDFGLAQIKDFRKLYTRDEIIGTFAYISPEQSGVIRRAIDERSDLYSLGITAYQLLTGGLPFEGDSVSEIIHQHIAMVPGSLRARNPRIPVMLDRIVLKLLEKDPDNRYQSARGLLDDIDKFLEGHDDFLPGLNDSITRLSYRTRMIGRDEEARRLMQVIDVAMEKRGGICLIDGEAGIGKTRLAEELKDYIYSKKGLFINGKCFPKENNTPYGPLKDALNLYLNHYENYPLQKKEEISEKIKSEFNNLGEIIITFNPVMKEILGECVPLMALQPESQNKRFQMVVSQFFHRLSDLEGLLVILIDDLHWSDSGTIDMIGALMKDISNHPLIIIGTYRNNELAKRRNLDDLIRTIRENEMPIEEVHLDLLNLEQLNIFISNLLSDSLENTIVISEFIHEKSKGNLFFTIEILKQLIREKVILYRDNHWKVDSSGLQKIEIPPTIVDIILKRIHLLDASEKTVLSCASVIGKNFDFTLLFKLSDLEHPDIVQAVDRAIALQLLEVNPLENDKIHFVHEKIKESFYTNIRKEDRKELHLRAAYAIEDMNHGAIDEVLFDLAYHYIEGEDKEKTIEYALPAGVKAKEKYAHEDAIGYFEKALYLLGDSRGEKNEQWILCKKKLGEIYITTGKYEKAIEIFNEILPFTRDSIERSNIFKQISGAWYGLGNWEKCEEYAAMGLELLCEKLPRTSLQVSTGVIKELAVHLLHSILPKIFVRTTENPLSERHRLIVAFYESLSMAYALNDPVKFIRLDLRFLNLCERHIGPSRELALSLFAYAGICMAIPIFTRAQKYHEKGLALNMKLDYQWGKAKNYELIGYYHEWRGDYRASRECFLTSLEMFTGLGDIKEMGLVLNGLEHCYFFVSDYHNAKITNDNYAEIAARTGDDYATSTADMYYARYYRETGNIEKAYHHARKANTVSLEKQIWFNYCISFLTLGSIALEAGEIEQAIAYLEESRILNEKNYFLKQYSVPVYYYLAQARMEDYVQKEQALTVKERKECIKTIRKACTRAIRKTKKWATHTGSAFRVNGNFYAMIGNKGKAEKFFSRSINQCKKTGRRFELARGYYDYGLFLLFQLNDIKNSRVNFESAYRIFKEIGATLYTEKLKNTLGFKEDPIDTSPIERFIDEVRISSIHALSLKMGRLSNMEELLNEILSTVTAHVGARRGYLFMADGENRELSLKASQDLSGSATCEYSRHIIEKVFSCGNAVITVDAGTDNRYIYINSIASSGLKSIVCVPIKSREETIGVCYLDNPLSSGVFTEKDINVLEEFFTRISVQIENIMHTGAKTPKGFYRQDYVTESTVEKIKNAIEYINNNYISDISREGLAAWLDINPDNLGRIFKKYTGKKISDYINELRIKNSADKLKNTDDAVIDIAFSVGFESLSTFNRVFYKIMKTTPTRYRNDH